MGGGGRMMLGQVSLKSGAGGGLALLLFNFSRFTIFTSGNNYSLQNCVMHLKKEKLFFFCYHNFMKKVILSCLKMNLKISHK